MNKGYIKKIGIIVVLLIVVISIFNAPTALAQDKQAYVSVSGISQINEAGNSKDLTEMVGLFFSYAIGIAVVLSVLFIIYGAVLYMTTDAFSQKSEGKEKIVSAIGGLILALISWLILETINPNLVRVNFNPPTIGGESSYMTGEEQIEAINEEVTNSFGNIGTTLLEDGTVVHNGTKEHYMMVDGKLEPLSNEYNPVDLIRAASSGGEEIIKPRTKEEENRSFRQSILDENF